MSERQKSKFARAFDITLSVIIALLVVLIVVLLFVATPMTVSGESMYPSLRDGDKVVVLKIGASIERGDIVVFERPGGSDPPVKRVIGMPGDVIRFDSAQRAYFVNGERLDDFAPEDGYPADYLALSDPKGSPSAMTNTSCWATTARSARTATNTAASRKIGSPAK